MVVRSHTAISQLQASKEPRRSFSNGGGRVCTCGHDPPCQSRGAGQWLKLPLAPTPALFMVNSGPWLRTLSLAHIKCSNAWLAVDGCGDQTSSGKWSKRLFPLQRWAGARCNLTVDKCCSIKYAVGLCPRHVFPGPWVTDGSARCVTWMVSTFAVIDLGSSSQDPHILWTLSTSCVQWTACARAYSARCARSYRETATVSVVARSRSWRQNACAVQPECARSA